MSTALERRLYSALLEERADGIHWHGCKHSRGVKVSGCPDLELHRIAAATSMIHDFGPLNPHKQSKLLFRPVLEIEPPSEEEP